MLYRITIENFFSIADNQEIFFGIPKNVPEISCLKTSRSDDKDMRLPAVVGFFGPNASGKSTILRAISSSLMFVLNSFDWKEQLILYFQPYKQKSWWGRPTKIVIEFDAQLNDADASSIFRYELQISHKANDFDNKAVLYEALSYAPKGKFKRLFERKEQEFYFGADFGILNANDPRKESIRANASVISTLTKLNHPVSTYLSRLVSTAQIRVDDFDKGQQNIERWLPTYANNESLRKGLNRELRRLDVGLEAMTVERDNQGLFARFKHEGLDESILFAEESQGTQRFINTFPLLHYALETGSIAVIDELDIELHPLLMPELFRWFSDPERNPHNAQLFFTAHNPALLNDLEKEQVFFVEKPSGKATYVYGARDIKGLRRGPSLMRKYISGELGAIPYVG